MITTTTSAKNANAITTDTISPGERRKVSFGLVGVPMMYTNAITNPYISCIFVAIYMVHMPQYILHKVLSSDIISKQFQNEILNF